MFLFYDVNNGPPHVCLLSQINPTNAPPPDSIAVRINLMLFSHLCLGHSTCLFPSGSFNKNPASPLFHTCHMPRPSHPPWTGDPVQWPVQVIQQLPSTSRYPPASPTTRCTLLSLTHQTVNRPSGTVPLFLLHFNDTRTFLATLLKNNQI